MAKILPVRRKNQSINHSISTNKIKEVSMYHMWYIGILFTTHRLVFVLAILTVYEVIAQRLPGNTAPLRTREIIPTKASTIHVGNIICEIKRQICFNKNKWQTINLLLLVEIFSAKVFAYLTTLLWFHCCLIKLAVFAKCLRVLPDHQKNVSHGAPLFLRWQNEMSIESRSNTSGRSARN